MAVFLAVVFSPFAAMLYLNRGNLALIYLLADVVAAVAVLPFVPLKAGHSPDALIWLAQFPVLVLGLVQSVSISRNWNPGEQRHWYSRWYATVGVLVLFPLTALLIRTFLFQPFDIPSSSMSPSVNQGDYLWVSKFAYNWSEPRRGDIIVFRAPQLDNAPYIKRIVGLPGDRVQMKAGILYINGKAARQRRVADFVEACGGQWPCRVPQFAESLPDGRIDFVIERIANGSEDNTPEFVVPPGSYFVLGDNRDNSMDSRNDMGFIRRSDIIGRASRKFVENGHWSWKPID